MAASRGRRGLILERAKVGKAPVFVLSAVDGCKEYVFRPLSFYVSLTVLAWTMAAVK
jgi:hypothetical protein